MKSGVNHIRFHKCVWNILKSPLLTTKSNENQTSQNSLASGRFGLENGSCFSFLLDTSTKLANSNFKGFELRISLHYEIGRMIYNSITNCRKDVISPRLISQIVKTKPAEISFALYFDNTTESRQNSDNLKSSNSNGCEKADVFAQFMHNLMTAVL